SKTREKTYFSAMKSDLKNLATQQEIYYSDPSHAYQYAPDVTTQDLDFAPSSGVTVGMASSGSTGWAATAIHQGLDATSQSCAVYYGTASSPQSWVQTAGVVTCTGE